MQQYEHLLITDVKKSNIRPWVNVIKHFTSVIYKCSKYVRASVPGEPFQPSLMFAGEARSLLKSGATERYSLGEALAFLANISLDWKGLPGIYTLACNKHS
jgi:hypothetical protein